MEQFYVSVSRGKQAENPTPKVRKLLGLAALAAQRQQDMISRVFETFMQEPDALHGGGSPIGSGVDLLEFIRQTLSAFQEQAAKRQIKVEVDGVAGEGNLLKVVAQKVNLERLLGNLLRHALSHSPPRGTVRLRLAIEEDTALVQVEDDCTDLPHDIHGAGFDAFARSSKTAIPDALALHFCRLVVENWGGQMGWSRREPAGNTFWFRLPRTQS